MKNTVLFALTIVLLSACAQKVKVRSLEPAEIDRAASTKKISVAMFNNDRVGLSSKIELSLASQKIDDKNYFTVVSRRDFEKIIKEQKIQNSGLVETSTVVEAGHIIGAEAIISGNVSNVLLKDSSYSENRTKCADKKCKETIKYSVNCLKREVSLSAELKMVDVEKGDIIYADTLSKSKEWRHCSDDSKTLPSRAVAAQELASSIANSFTYKMTPHYSYFKVALLEDGDLDYTDEQEKLLELSLAYIEQGRYDKAERFLVELIDSTDQQSYVAFYNLGVVKEAQGKYNEAKSYYKKADYLMGEPVEEISLASLRIDRLIHKHNKTKEQLQR